MDTRYQMDETLENHGKTVAFTHEKYVFKGLERKNLLQNHLHGMDHAIKIKVSQTVRKTIAIKADAKIEVQKV